MPWPLYIYVPLRLSRCGVLPARARRVCLLPPKEHSDALHDAELPPHPLLAAGAARDTAPACGLPGHRAARDDRRATSNVRYIGRRVGGDREMGGVTSRAMGTASDQLLKKAILNRIGDIKRLQRQSSWNTGQMREYLAEVEGWRDEFVGLYPTRTTTANQLTADIVQVESTLLVGEITALIERRFTLAKYDDALSKLKRLRALTEDLTNGPRRNALRVIRERLLRQLGDRPEVNTPPRSGRRSPYDANTPRLHPPMRF